ncbi:DgyrCDS7006 [Dimorphilus gyrociliatus]|uniref:DgyrCDS7006 n=1 Tax=Dimorphilus gyrociliatus TaxID=2664684 RepID=A0A7I8VRF3_9ANNE|nr:DgyrCDS7006 [Dimorphilus gyrociliatus]
MEYDDSDDDSVQDYEYKYVRRRGKNFCTCWPERNFSFQRMNIDSYFYLQTNQPLDKPSDNLDEVLSQVETISERDDKDSLLYEEDEDGGRCGNGCWGDEDDSLETDYLLGEIFRYQYGPFSALAPSMIPRNMTSKFNNNHEYDILNLNYDEFGNKIEDSYYKHSNKLLNSTTLRDVQQRKQWIGFLKLLQKESELHSWRMVRNRLPKTKELYDMVIKGIPHSIRPKIWIRLTGALSKKSKLVTSYTDMVKASSIDQLQSSKQIEKDLLRTMPNSACFCSKNSIGIPKLRRLLRAIAWLYPDIGYCQGTGMIAASMLLILEEEDAFWMVCSIIEDLQPTSYYSNSLLGAQADQRVLAQCIKIYLPEVDKLLQEYDLDASVIFLHWFLTAFASVVNIKVLVRIWDIFFFDGSIFLFRITLAILTLKEKELLSCNNANDFVLTLSEAPTCIDDIEYLIQISTGFSSSLTENLIETYRRKYLASLLTSKCPNSQLDSTKERSGQNLAKRFSWGSWPAISNVLRVTNEDDETLESKNIRQTNIIVNLREAILQIGKHFQSLDTENIKLNLMVDYTMNSHAKDLENYASVDKHHRRRAKALIDFENHNEDELTFHKNDIITIISKWDEHIWIAELNGVRGWIPAQFVELLDERSKSYSCAGDDSVSEAITDLIIPIY